MKGKALILHEANKERGDNRQVHITNNYYRNDDMPPRMTYTPELGGIDPITSYIEPVRNNVDDSRRMIGYGNRSNMTYLYPDTRNEMQSRHTTMERGYGETTEDWINGLKNVDGTSGAHWSLDQTKSVMQQRGYKCDPHEFWAVMNMMYSDYSKVAKRMGIDNTEFYAAMADAFLNDPDGGEDKLTNYMYCVK